MANGSRFLTQNAIINRANGRKGVLVENQIIESTFAEEYTSNQTDLVLIEPGDGNRLVTTDVAIHTKANSGEIELDIGDIKVARLYSSANNRFNPQVKSGVGDVGEPLTLTTTTGDNKVFISINYIELAGDN